MGKKATWYLIHIIALYFSIFIAALSIGARAAGLVDPTEHVFTALLGLIIVGLLITNLVLVIFWALCRKWWILIPICALAVNYNYISSIVQFPRSYDNFKQPDLKIATYNIHEFRHGNFKITVQAMAEFLKQEHVEITCFQEFDINPKFNLDSIRKAFYFMPYVYAPFEDASGLNLAIFSKYPILNAEHIKFPGTDNNALRADINVNGKRVRIFNAHFQTTNINQSKQEINMLKGGISNQEEKMALYTIINRLHNNFAKRAVQQKTIRAIIDTTSCPIIVCGDFNDTPASYVYHQMKRGLTDGFQSCGSGYQYTYKGIGHLLRIDYIMYSKEFEGMRYYSSNQEWSDHNPVLLELAFRSGEAER